MKKGEHVKNQGYFTEERPLKDHIIGETFKHLFIQFDGDRDKDKLHTSYNFFFKLQSLNPDL